MANAVMEAAATTPGKEAIAMEAFAKALSELPTAIAENGGFDSAQLVSELRALHKQNQTTMGLGKTSFKNLQDELDAVVVNADDQETSTAKQVSRQTIIEGYTFMN